MITEEIRSYEVSLWTLLDEFITVLKWSDVEQKGRIENPKMTLNIDGTEKFTFSIPMYYREGRQLVENPSWYNVRNGNLLVGLRKIKVIFDKDNFPINEASEHVFEFVITSVTENHEEDILTCEIESEGLAFLELGKIGYKINLSLENFELQYEDWQEKGMWLNKFNLLVTTEPVLTLDYWCTEIGLEKLPATLTYVVPSKWYYDVRMNWDRLLDLNLTYASDKVYEEGYTSSWLTDNGVLRPRTVEKAREKARTISVENSNIYNITLTIAEQFLIYCRYEYLYNANYNIIGRVVVFYNNFFMENEPPISLLYPYMAKKIERNIDSSNITTKLFVLDVDNDTVLDGKSSIMNALPNASKEDYILNFDYLHEIGAISDELYESIPDFEIVMRYYNEELEYQLTRAATYQSKITDLKAKLTVAINSINLDKENIEQNTALYNALDVLDGDADGLISVTAANSDYLLIITNESGESYINVKNTNKGIKEDTILIFKTFSSTPYGPLLTNPINSFILNHDEYNNLTSITLCNASELVLSSITKTDWNKIFKDCYTPAGYNGNVNIMYRPIVPAAKFIEAGYTDFEGEYGTVFTSSISETDKNGNTYDIVYTPIGADGTVYSDMLMLNYLNSIITSSTSKDEWLSADKADKKLLLFVGTLPSGWEEDLHNRLAEWDEIRAKNTWFGYESNPSKIEFDDISYSSLTYCSAATYNANTTTETINTSKVYLTYKYDPHLYYDNVIKTWQRKLALDIEAKNEYTRELGPETDNDSSYDLSIYPSGTTLLDAYEKGYYSKLLDAKVLITSLTIAKNLSIKKFEQTMGPALREGYWQPEDYSDYGQKYNLTSSITYGDITLDTEDMGMARWDRLLFDDELTSYYKIGINETIEYYPIINLETIFGNNIPTDLDQYSLVWKSSSRATNWNEVLYLSVLSVNSLLLIRYIPIASGDPPITKAIPVLVVVGAKTYTPKELEYMIVNGEARLEKYSTSVGANGNIAVTHTDIYYVNDAWICYTSLFSKPTNWSNDLWEKYTYTWLDNEYSSLCYPRIKFSSLLLKTDSNNLFISYNNHKLDVGDYYINTRDTERWYWNEATQTAYPLYFLEYYITIKPEILIKYGFSSGTVRVNYTLSNANIAIYLDAKKISKENAYPKVSYNVEASVWNRDLSKNLYSRRALIVMINDTDLKLEDAFGYISNLELDLDNLANDIIEVKNYSSKFEDLFSTIVALTEDMKRMGNRLSTTVAGDNGLSSEGFEETISNADLVLKAYLDSHFDSSEVVKRKLRELFTEAGEILSDSKNTLNSMRALTLENADILSGFIKNVSEELSVKVYRSSKKPDSFKVGDIWIDDNGNRYVATASSADSGYGLTSGFVRTYDGTLASITGAALNINADDGIIDIEAQNQLNIKSGNNIYIAANEKVDIVGNKEVNIGGTTINIGSTSTLTEDWGGINLVASSYSDVKSSTLSTTLSKVLISPRRIELGSSDIYMRGANKILMVTSRGTSDDTSAIEISPDTGVWIGSGQGIRLFSGGFSYNETTNTLTKTAATGAAVELNSSHLILGFANTQSNNGNAIELDQDKIIIASGNVTTGSGDVALADNDSITGLKLTKSSFGLAVGNNTSRSVILADLNGITVGSGTNPKSANLTGSYVNISGSGVEIGSLGNLYLNTNNIKLLSDSTYGTRFALGYNMLNISSGTDSIASASDSRMGSTSGHVGLVYNTNGLYINGNVYAATFVATGNGQLLIANSNKLGFYTTASTPVELLTISSSGISAQHGFDISATNIAIKSNPASGGNYFYTGDSNKYIKYTSAGALEVKGTVIATSFTLSGETALTEFATAISNSGVNFGTDGISTLTWNGGTYVGLTSTVGSSGSNNGILIGVSESANVTQHIIVPYAANNTKTIVDISKNGIYFDHYNTTPSANDVASNYIHMDTNGIDVMGNRISINGKEVWGRDDIIFSASEPAVHPTDRDWVWIKPNSNVNSIFRAGIESYQNYTNAYDLQLAANNNNLTYNVTTGHVTLTAQWAVALDLLITSGGTTEITYVADIIFYNLSSRQDNHFSLKLSASKNGAPVGLTITSSIPSVSLGYKDPTAVSIVLALNVTNNLLSEIGATLKFQTDTNINNCFIVGVTITAMVLDAVASNTRVLCDVFYCSET